MTAVFPLRTAAKIAFREARVSSFKFGFVILAVAVGVGALTGVRGFSRAFHRMLLREARTLMAGDLSVRTFLLPTAAETRAMDEVAALGAPYTWITETISMAAADPSKPPVLTGVKAVDPRRYPWYGAVRLEPPERLGDALKPDTVVVSEDLLMRLNVSVGDSIRIGGQPFRIVAVLKEEPDRMVGNLNVGPRIMMSREGLERASLILPGSRAAERFLFKLPPTLGVDAVRAKLKKAFPESQIVDFREAHPILQQGLNQATTFLSLVSLVSLIVGALGVATAVHAHLQQRLDSLAIMKCIGARSGQIMRIYVLQTLALAVAGGLLGIGLGLAVQAAFPYLIARYFAVRPPLTLDWLSALQGLAIAALTSLLFTAPPLLGIRRIKPSLIFRREMAEVKPRWRERIWRNKAALGAAVLLILGIGAIAGSLITGARPHDAARIGAYFVIALVASLCALAVIAWALLRALRMLSRKMVRAPAPVRHGIANLYRPGNHAEATLVALGAGVMFTLTVYLVQSGMIADMSRTAPPGMPNVFLLDIAPKNAAAVLDLIRRQHGIESGPEVIGAAPARLVSVNGVTLDKMKLVGFSRRFRFTRQVTSIGERPAYAAVVNGAWWTGRPRTPEVCVSADAAPILRVRPGSHMQWQIGGRDLDAKVACIVRIDSVHLVSRLDFIFSPGVIDGAPIIYYGSVRVQPEAASALQVAMYQRFPTVTVINVAEVLRIVQEVVSQIAIEVRFIAGFVILAGVIILASSVAGTRFRRIREVVILKTLGATRAKIAAVFSVEFLILGGVAGLTGAALAVAFSALVMKRLLRASVHIEYSAVLIAVVATAVAANAAGWLASYRVLGQKPLEALREE
ncbi:MAG TPA: FtsX-like permease family protein [Bryobacteraceae bacterium]|nr:FtsX-like permease family protein [Bryobacteraceae bacterium]